MILRHFGGSCASINYLLIETKKVKNRTNWLSKRDLSEAEIKEGVTILLTDKLIWLNKDLLSYRIPN